MPFAPAGPHTREKMVQQRLQYDQQLVDMLLQSDDSVGLAASVENSNKYLDQEMAKSKLPQRPDFTPNHVSFFEKYSNQSRQVVNVNPDSVFGFDIKQLNGQIMNTATNISRV